MIRKLFEQLLGVDEAEEDKIAFAKEKPNIIQQDKAETEQDEEEAEEEAGEITPDEEDEDVEPEGSKEYLGNNGTDQYFYFVKTPNEQGKAKDLQVIDSSGKILFSAEENGLAVDNVKDFLMQALKEVDMANIAFEALMKYMIPAEEKSEEEIEDEKAQKENEVENANNPDQSSKDRQDGISAPPMPVGVGSRVGESKKIIKKIKEAKLEKWGPKHEENYLGESYPEYYVGFAKSRDSEALGVSNFDVALSELGGEKEPDVKVVRLGHWAVGWIEVILVHENAKDKVEILKQLIDRVNEYPVLDEQDYWQKQEDMGENEDDVDEKKKKSIKLIKDLKEKFGLNETGEMSNADILPGGEDYEWAKAIEDDVKAIEKEVGDSKKFRFVSMLPFDKYQGPFASTNLGRIWDAGVEGEQVLYLEKFDWIGDFVQLADAIKGDQTAINLVKHQAKSLRGEPVDKDFNPAQLKFPFAESVKEKLCKIKEEDRYKSDSDIEAEFEGMKITNIEVNPGGISGWIEIEFPEGEEHVGGGTTEVVDHWIKYPHNGKVALENWYPEKTYFEIVRQIEKKLSGKGVSESKLKKDLKGVKDGKPITFKEGQAFTYGIVKNTDDGTEQVVFKFNGGGNAQVPASSKEEYVIEGKAPSDPATDPEGYMGELMEKYGLIEESVREWHLTAKLFGKSGLAEDGLGLEVRRALQALQPMGIATENIVVREIGVSESSFGSVEWQKDQVMKILGKLKHGIELDGADKAFVSTQAGFLNMPDDAYLEKLKKIAAKAAASERKIKEIMDFDRDKLRMLEMKHELVEAKSLEELRGTIDDEVEFVDIKPYSHNIISLSLQMISKEYGNEEANKAIDDFDLESLGWKKIQEGVYERTVNEQIPELPKAPEISTVDHPVVDEPTVGDPNASQPEDAIAPEIEVAPSTAEEAQSQIQMDYPEEPFTSTALAYADLIFDDPQIFGAIRNLNWDGIYANGDTFIKQVKIIDHYNKFTKEVAQRIVDKFGGDAKYKLAREGSVATYITVLSPTENLSLTGLKDLTNADKAELTNSPGEIRLWWD